MLIWIPLPPTPKGNNPRLVWGRKGGHRKRPLLLPSKAASSCQKALTRLLRASAPPSPLECPVRRDALFCLPVPQSWPLWRKAAARQHRFLPPGGGRQADTGNLVKLLDDALEGAGLIANDGQIVGGEAWKVYAGEPGYLIRLLPLPQATRAEGSSPLQGWWTSDAEARKEATPPWVERGGQHQERNVRRPGRTPPF